MGYDFRSLTKQIDEADNREKFYTDFEDVDPNTLHQISDLTEWIRTKGKGSDVREIIAQLFERTWLEGTKEGNANMEVAQARGKFDTLDKRLDANQRILADKIDNISFKTIDLNKGKITQNMLSDTVLSQIAGNANINAVPADNSITSNKITASAIGFRELNLEANNLLFEKSDSLTTTENCFYDIKTGERISSTTRKSTGYVPIPLGTSILTHSIAQEFDSNYGWVVFDKNKTFLYGGIGYVIPIRGQAAFCILSSPYDARGRVDFISTLAHQAKTNLQHPIVSNKTWSKSSYLIRHEERTDRAAYKTTDFIEIPEGTSVLYNDAQYAYVVGTAGWVLYNKDKSPISRGQGSLIPVPVHAKYVRLTDYNPNQLPRQEAKIIFLGRDWGKYGLGEQFIGLPKNDYFTKNKKLNISNGVMVTSDASVATNTSDFLLVPSGAAKLIFDIVFTENMGWCQYDEYYQFLAGGDSNEVTLHPKCQYIRVTTKSIDGVKIRVVSPDELLLREGAITKFSNKSIAFLGDSITYGFDPEHTDGRQMARPWVSQIGDKLKFKRVLNFGVNSAVLSSKFGRARNLTMSQHYEDIPADVDFVFVQGGINDVYNRLPLGSMADRTNETIYGSLHILIKLLLERFPPEQGKTIIFSNYFKYDQVERIRTDMTWQDFVNAVSEVCSYYSIPVCDMSNNLGISPYSDFNYKFWKSQNGGLHDAHPTQLGADRIAVFVARYLENNF